MNTFNKDHAEATLKIAHTNAGEVCVLWRACRMYSSEQGYIPEDLMDLLERRMNEVAMTIADLINPFPF